MCNSPNFSTASTQILGLISGVYVATNNNVAVRTKIIPMFSLSYIQKKKKIVLFFLVDCHYILSSTVNLWSANLSFFFHTSFGKNYCKSIVVPLLKTPFNISFNMLSRHVYTFLLFFCCFCFIIIITVIIIFVLESTSCVPHTNALISYYNMVHSKGKFI